MAKPNDEMSKFFWIDLEMTGLDVKKDRILEVAAIVTDLQFNTLETYESVVWQSPEVIAGMNAWCQKTHRESGLVDRIPHGKPLGEVEADLLALIHRHFAADERIVLAGNSVSNDQAFLLEYCRKFAERLHYRVIDVSSFKQVFKSCYGVKVNKTNKHRAIDDILESIAELKHYLSFISVKS